MGAGTTKDEWATMGAGRKQAVDVSAGTTQADGTTTTTTRAGAMIPEAGAQVNVAWSIGAAIA
eukprot:13627134-Heterocapsa_arctica.AAC.1